MYVFPSDPVLPTGLTNFYLEEAPLLLRRCGVVD